MIALIDCGSNKTATLAQLIQAKTTCEIIPFADFTAQSVAQAHGIIISGSPLLLSDRNMEADLQQTAFLKTISKPILGICFGHQLLAVQFGAKYWTDSPVRRSETMITLSPSMLFADFPPTFNMEERHTEYVGLPDNFTHSLTSTSCYNEAMAHIEKPIWGVQFHPESSGELGIRILHNFLGYCAYYNGEV